jgi:Condensation domain
MNQIDPTDTAYHMYLTWRICGPLDAGMLADALSGLVSRHEIPRTRFPASGGTPAQVVDPPTAVRLERADATLSNPGGREYDRAELEGAARDVLVERIKAPFDLARGPMLRATLIRLAADDHVLGLTFHHIVADGWSLGLLCAELSTRYRSARRQCDPALCPHCRYSTATTPYGSADKTWLSTASRSVTGSVSSPQPRPLTCAAVGPVRRYAARGQRP